MERKFQKIVLSILVILVCGGIQSGAGSRDVQAEPQIIVSEDAKESIRTEPATKESGEEGTILTDPDQTVTIPAGNDMENREESVQKAADRNAGEVHETPDEKKKEMECTEGGPKQKREGQYTGKEEQEWSNEKRENDTKAVNGKRDEQSREKMNAKGHKADFAGKSTRKSEESDRQEKKQISDAVAKSEKRKSADVLIEVTESEKGEKSHEKEKPEALMQETQERESEVMQEQAAETAGRGIPETGIMVVLIVSGIGLALLFIRQKSVFGLYAKGKDGTESRVGSLRVSKKEEQYVLEIPAEMLFRQKEEIYRLRPGKLFYRSNKGQMLYVSCMGRSFEAKIDRQITFSI